MFKKLANILSAPLAHIASICLETGIFPSKWKIVDVIALSKGIIADINNIRPISLRSCVSVFLEWAILRRIEKYILPLIGPNQFGFRKDSSTCFAIIRIFDVVTRWLEEKSVSAVSIVGFNLKKASDTVPHSILFSKLQTVLPERLLKMVSSFLSQRYQRTKINGIFSPVLPVSSGVPQGALNFQHYFFFFLLMILCSAQIQKLSNLLMTQYF